MINPSILPINKQRITGKKGNERIVLKDTTASTKIK